MAWFESDFSACLRPPSSRTTIGLGATVCEVWPGYCVHDRLAAYRSEGNAVVWSERRLFQEAQQLRVRGMDRTGNWYCDWLGVAS